MQLLSSIWKELVGGFTTDVKHNMLLRLWAWFLRGHREIDGSYVMLQCMRAGIPSAALKQRHALTSPRFASSIRFYPGNLEMWFAVVLGAGVISLVALWRQAGGVMLSCRTRISDLLITDASPPKAPPLDRQTQSKTKPRDAGQATPRGARNRQAPRARGTGQQKGSKGVKRAGPTDATASSRNQPNGFKDAKALETKTDGIHLHGPCSHAL